MTYISGGLIQATDYNGFVGNTTAGANINAMLGYRICIVDGDKHAISTVSAGGTVTATQWATLVNNLATWGPTQEPVQSLTSRTQPVAGNVIAFWPTWQHRHHQLLPLIVAMLRLLGTQYGVFSWHHIKDHSHRIRHHSLDHYIYTHSDFCQCRRCKITSSTQVVL
jgi:hypothetical protein